MNIGMKAMRASRKRPLSDAASVDVQPSPEVGVAHRIGPPSECAIDESLMDSFPASDPPSWTVGARIGGPR